MQVDYFKNETNFVDYAAGDLIFDERQPGDVMYVVKEGTVEITHDGEVLETCEAGCFFGEMALIDRKVRAAAAVAKTDCKLILVDKRRFLFLVQETPTFAIQVMHEMAERIRRLTDSNMIMEIGEDA